MQTHTTIQEVLSRWCTTHCLNRKPKTAQHYQIVLRWLLRTCPCPDASPTELSDTDLLAWAGRLTHLSASLWNSFVSAWRTLTPHARLLPRRRIRLRVFVPPSQAEFDALLAEADRNRRCQIGLVLRFLCLTGLRIGEAHALRWSDVRPDGIWVRPEVSKNGRGRLVPILPDLPPVLERLRALEAARHDGLVLPPANPRAALARVSRRVLGQPWSPHLCRHFFATHCIRCGVDLPTVARWLGHQDGGALLARTY